jgi:hypothetical protein
MDADNRAPRFALPSFYDMQHAQVDPAPPCPGVPAAAVIGVFFRGVGAAAGELVSRPKERSAFSPEGTKVAQLPSLAAALARKR